MGVTSQIHPAGYPIFTLTFGDEVVRVSAFGGQIIAWEKCGEPLVFENRDRAIADGKTPYRGGAPICFPFFGKGTLLPLGTPQEGQHGKARVSTWGATLLDAENAVTLTTHQPSPDGYGPTEFSCEITYTLGEQLDVRAAIRNVGGKESPFQFAVHAYWATAEPAAVSVEGLGSRYLDNLLGLSEQNEKNSSQPHPAPFDRIYLDDESRLGFTTGRHHISISTAGCSGTVLWNPGKNHNLKDLGSPDFICVESGVVVPSQSLAPGQEHVVEISYKAEAKSRPEE